MLCCKSIWTISVTYEQLFRTGLSMVFMLFVLGRSRRLRSYIIRYYHQIRDTMIYYTLHAMNYYDLQYAIVYYDGQDGLYRAPWVR